MSSTYFKKDEYIERCNKQVKNIGQIIDALGYIKCNLPENGKPFGTRQTKVLNNFLETFDCTCGIYKDCFKITYLVVQLKEYSSMPCNNAEIGHKKESEFFKNGVINNRDSVIKEIDEKITQYAKVRERYKSAPSKIDDFISSYQKLYDMWKNVRDFDMPEIYIDSISQYPPIR